jgi:integrase
MAASAERYTLADGRERWRARWRDSGRASRQKDGFTGKRAAEKYAKAHEVDAGRGEDVIGTRATVGECLRAELDLRSGSIRATSLRVYRQAVVNFERHPTFTRQRVTTLDEDTCQRAINWLSLPKEDGGLGLAPKSVQGHVGFLVGTLQRAARKRWINWRTVEEMTLKGPEVTRPEIVPLTVPQMIRIANAVPPHMRAMVLAQAGLGLRIGELSGLRVHDVTWPADVVGATPLLHTARVGSVHIDSQIHSITGQRCPLKNSRYPSGRPRDVPLPAALARELLAHMEAYPPLAWRGERLIFYPDDGRGQPYSMSHSHNGYYRIMPKVAERVGADDPDWPARRMHRRITSHDLRHHYVSILGQRGESVPTIARRIGDTEGVVLKVYLHMLPNREQDTVDAIDEAWAEAARQESVGLSCDVRPLHGG